MFSPSYDSRPMAFSLLQSLSEIPLAVIDVETTGASVDFGHRVIELGIVRVEQGQKVAEYQQLFDPNRRVGPGITALTGISQQMVDGQPRFIDQIDSISQLLGGAAILGHNVRFDLSFINKEFRHAGGSCPPCWVRMCMCWTRFALRGDALVAVATAWVGSRVGWE